jgi:plastocyanin
MNWRSYPRSAGRSKVVLLLTLAACAGDGNNGPQPPPSLVVAKAPGSGDAQTGTAATALANPIRVLITRDGTPVSGVTVTWNASGTGASMFPPSSTTDATGVAEAIWTLPQTSGTGTATATVSGAGGSPANFTATVLAGPATQLRRMAGDAQTGVINAALPVTLEVMAADQFGNGVAGVNVAWQATGGSGSLAPSPSATGASGATTTIWTLGSVLGPQGAEAMATGLAGSPVAFTAIGILTPVTVSVENNFFAPNAITIPAGTQVRWVWAAGAGSHSVQSTGSPIFANSVIMTGGGSVYTHIFSTPGVYTYQCMVHGAAMSGMVTVN